MGAAAGGAAGGSPNPTPTPDPVYYNPNPTSNQVGRLSVPLPDVREFGSLQVRKQVASKQHL